MKNMKKRLYLMRVVKIFSLLLAVAVFVLFSQEYLLLEYDHNNNKMRVEGFYREQQDSLDVVIMGASEVYSGFSSGLAYDEYGITSYAFTPVANPVSLYKIQLKEILSRQSPKMIVVEVNGALYDDFRMTKPANIRNYIDNMPTGRNKFDAISQLVPLKKQVTFYLPVLKYHEAWKSFPENFSASANLVRAQLRGYNLLMSESTYTSVFHSEREVLNPALADDDSTEPLAPRAEEYLRDFLAFCRNERIENIVFVRYPHVITDALENDMNMYTNFKRGNEAGRIIAEYGYDYINFERMPEETGIDPFHDFYNEGHLNIYGEIKMTRYLSRLLCEKYDVSPSGSLTDTQKKKWDSCADYAKRYFVYSDRKLRDGEKMWVIEDSDILRELKKINPPEELFVGSD